ncbi:MAG: TM2 domain-containing protein [Clostridia bacterium]|nr:TM2 domain-containing protein [Clostridia bacterium]
MNKISYVAGILISFFLGGLGIHRFLAGKIGTGIIWLLTGGCLGIGALVDFIMIILKKFTNKNGEIWAQD